MLEEAPQLGLAAVRQQVRRQLGQHLAVARREERVGARRQAVEHLGPAGAAAARARALDQAVGAEGVEVLAGRLAREPQAGRGLAERGGAVPLDGLEDAAAALAEGGGENVAGRGAGEGRAGRAGGAAHGPNLAARPDSVN